MSAIKKSKFKKRKQLSKANPLRVVYSRSKDEQEKLIQGIWIMAQSTFWNNQQFKSSETNELKKLVAMHFENKQSVKQNFKDLAERICLAKRFVARRSGRYISKPLDWLNINFRTGLSGTTAWLDAVKIQRATVPHYNEGIATLAEGILKFIESPEVIVFNHYRRKLQEQKQFDLLQIYYNTILNLQYSK